MANPLAQKLWTGGVALGLLVSAGAASAGGGFVSLPTNLATYPSAARTLAEAEQAAPPADPFLQTLRAAYLEYANYEFQKMRDFVDALFHAERALRAAQGEMVEPLAVGDRNIPIEYQSTLATAGARLTAVINAGGASKAPEATAKAIAAYDCWLEQQEENFQPEDIARCRKTFEDNLQVAEAAVAPQVPQVITLEADILFDFDKAVIRDEFKPTLDEIAALLRDNPDVQVFVDGFTDTKGPAAYNQRLSERRAQAVADYLAARGVAPERMTVRGFGETRLAVPTPDETEEPRNRRVEIRRR